MNEHLWVTADDIWLTADMVYGPLQIRYIPLRGHCKYHGPYRSWKTNS